MTANWYSTDDTSTSTNSSSSETRIESPVSTDDDSGTPPEPPEFEFEIIATTNDFIEKLTKRWWNFVGKILDGTGNPAKTLAGTAEHRDEVIPLAPHFTGLRIALGGDKHTH